MAAVGSRVSCFPSEAIAPFGRSRETALRSDVLPLGTSVNAHETPLEGLGVVVNCLAGLHAPMRLLERRHQFLARLRRIGNGVEESVPVLAGQHHASVVVQDATGALTGEVAGGQAGN